jgi:nanoRNase/pAp phosphatase (c-di-AMP/oligoRNAs hydrolase)
MSNVSQADSKIVRIEVGAGALLPPSVAKSPMKTFVESCLNTVAGSAVAVERRTRHRPRADKLLKALAGKKNVLVTTHQHPDPDALASSHALAFLLSTKLKDATVTMSVKGKIGGGLNDAFTKHANLKLVPWDDEAVASKYDAILLLDTQPSFTYSPLPAGVKPTAVIDHHRTRGRNPKCPFCDIRADVGATTSIIFSYFLELQVAIPADLAAAMLYAIETDLAGAAGQPGELDNIALSNLTLTADTRKLYQMRYVDLPQSFYVAMNAGVSNAMFYDNAIISHLDSIDSLEKPAVIADVLLRFDQVQWSLVTAQHENREDVGARGHEAAGEEHRRGGRAPDEGGGRDPPDQRDPGGGGARADGAAAAVPEGAENRRGGAGAAVGAGEGLRLVWVSSGPSGAPLNAGGDSRR